MRLRSGAWIVAMECGLQDADSEPRERPGKEGTDSEARRGCDCSM